MDENLLQKIEDMYDEVMGMISNLTTIRPDVSKGIKIIFETVDGRQEIEIPTSLENLASGKTEVDL